MSQTSKLFEFQFSGREKEQEILGGVIARALKRRRRTRIHNRRARGRKDKTCDDNLGKEQRRRIRVHKSEEFNGSKPSAIFHLGRLSQALTAQMSVQAFFDACGRNSRLIMKLLPGIERFEERGW